MIAYETYGKYGPEFTFYTQEQPAEVPPVIWSGKYLGGKTVIYDPGYISGNVDYKSLYDGYPPSWVSSVRLVPHSVTYDSSPPDETRPPKGDEIKMTTYYRSKITETQHLCSVPYRIWPEIVTVFNAYNYKVSSANKQWSPPFYKYAQIDNRYTLEYIRDNGYVDESTPYGSGDFESTPQEEVDRFVNDVMKDVVLKLGTDLDVLTSIAELKATLELIQNLIRSVRSPLSSAKAYLKRLAKKKSISKWQLVGQIHKDLGSAWMQYRYGIMPIMYDIRNLVKVLEGLSLKFLTVRSMRTGTYQNVLPTEDAPFNQNGVSEQYYTRCTEKYEVRAVGKARFSSSWDFLYSSLGLNPFVTAWELVPFSFVCDWFLNVGEYIQCISNNITNVLSDKTYCYSIKKVKETEHFLKYKQNSLLTREIYGKIYEMGDVHVETLHLGTTLEESYTRRVFRPDDVKLSASFDLGWKQWVDSYVLTTQTASKHIARLKRK